MLFLVEVKEVTEEGSYKEDLVRSLSTGHSEVIFTLLTEIVAVFVVGH